MSIVSNMLRPNLLYDAQSTEAAREAAESAVEEVLYMQGENIVREGERITDAQYEMLKSLGMVANSDTNYTRYIALLAIEFLIFLIYGFYLKFAHENVLSSPKMLLTVSAVAVISLLGGMGWKPYTSLYSTCLFHCIYLRNDGGEKIICTGHQHDAFGACVCHVFALW